MYVRCVFTTQPQSAFAVGLRDMTNLSSSLDFAVYQVSKPYIVGWVAWKCQQTPTEPRRKNRKRKKETKERQKNREECPRTLVADTQGCQVIFD